MVLRSNNPGAVSDLVWASLMFDETGALGFSICADYIIDRRGSITEPSSYHLRSFLAHHLKTMPPWVFPMPEGRGGFVEVLSALHIGVEKWGMVHRWLWKVTLLETIQFVEARCLALHSWKFLAEFATTGPSPAATYNPDITISLMNAQEWDKLECWVGIVWMECPPELGNLGKELEDAMEALEKERPGALRKRMEQWSKICGNDLPESFQQTCEKLAL